MGGTAVHQSAAYAPRLAAEFDRGAATWREDATLVFADLSGFTRLSERLATRGRIGAEQLVEVLNGAFTALLTEAVDCGADLLKFGGDALLLLVRGDDHVDRAAAAAVAMRRALAARPAVEAPRGAVRLRMSVGVATGEVMVVAAGTAYRELVLIGPVATELANLEKVASAGQIVVGATTAARLRRHRCGARLGDGFLLSTRRVDPVLVGPAPAAIGALDPLRYVPPALRSLAAAGGAPEHRRAAVAFVKVTGVDDIVAATGLAGAARRVARMVESAEQISAAHEVALLASDLSADGYKLIVLAGAPVASDDDSERLLLAAREIAATGGDGISVRVGVNRGAVFAGDVGAPFRRAYTAIGDVVNLAARLAERAAEATVVASLPALASASAEFAATSLGEWTLKGKAQPVGVWEVGGPTGGRRTDPTDAPLFGRDDEIARLLTVASRGRGAVEVHGPPGSGVSRMLREVEQRIAPQRRVVRAWGTAARGARPWQVTARLIADAAAVVRADGDTTLTEVLRAVRAVGAEPDEPALGAVVAPSRLPHTNEPFDARRIVAAVDAALTALLPPGSVVLIDDAHHLDDADGTVVSRLAGVAEARGWMVVIGRTGGAASFDLDTTVSLGPLPAKAARQVAAELLGEGVLAPAAAERIVERASGNPQVLVHLLRAAATGSTDELPDSVESVAAVQLDALEPRTRMAVRRLAIVGTVVPRHLVAVAIGAEAGRFSDLEPADPVHDVLAVDDEVLRFRSDVLRDAARAGLPYAERRAVHAAVYAALAAADEGAAPGMLAEHALHGGLPADAWKWGVVAAQAAMAAGAPASAVASAECALAAAVAMGGPRRPDGAASHAGAPSTVDAAALQELLGDAADLMGAFDRADKAYRTARQLVDDEVDAGRLRGKQASMAERRGELARAAAGHRDAFARLSLLTSDRAVAARAKVLVDLAGVHLRRGSSSAAEATCRRAVVDASAVGDRRVLAHAFYLLDAATTDLGQPTMAYRNFALPIFEELGDLVMVGSVHNNLGVNAHFEGRWDEAVQHYRAAAEALRRAGHVAAAATAANNLGEIESDRGQLDEAEASFDEAALAFRLARFPIGIAVVTANRGRLALRRQRFDEAGRLLDEAHGRFAEIGAMSFLAEVAVRRAELVLARGEAAEALAGIEQARALHGDLGQSSAAAARAEAAAFTLLGRTAEAASAWAEAVAAAERYGLAHEAALAVVAAGGQPGVPGDPVEAAAALDALGIAWRGQGAAVS